MSLADTPILPADDAGRVALLAKLDLDPDVIALLLTLRRASYTLAQFLEEVMPFASRSGIYACAKSGELMLTKFGRRSGITAIEAAKFLAKKRRESASTADAPWRQQIALATKSRLHREP